MIVSATTDVEVSGARIRRIVLERAYAAGVGHIGSALSVADLLAVLYGRTLRISRPDDPDRDRFILSKGHAALALYAALHLRGWITAADLATYCGETTRLGVHPEKGLPGIDFSTGSLAMGPSFGVGAALAARMQESGRRIYVLVSDGEFNEGSIWEAAAFAGHHRLSNLVIVADVNGQQALDYTERVLNQGNLAEQWSAFGWHVKEVDGHDERAIARALVREDCCTAPHFVLARTVFGKGVSFMERQIKWHYLPMSPDDFARALAETAAR